MTIRESVEKEMNIYAMYCENTVDTALAISEIDMYTEGAVDSIKEFANKIIQAIKDFIQKAKNAFKKKLDEFKAKRDLRKIEAMWKKNINNVATVTNFVEEKEIRKEVSKAVSKVSKICQQAVGAKDSSKVEALAEELQNVVRDMGIAIEKKQKKLKIKLSGSPEKMIEVEEFYEFLGDTAENAVDALAKKAAEIEQKLEKSRKIMEESGDDAGADEIAAEKAKISAIQKGESEISKITTTGGNWFSRNRSMLLGAIRGCATGAFLGAAVGSLIGGAADQAHNGGRTNEYQSQGFDLGAAYGAGSGAIRGALAGREKDKARNGGGGSN
uniref:Uncharacterized protein n=1 Tax=Myoviridae sp. ctaOv25 TaxID=2827290 RepID=A0A8S5R6C3_9CAUD|nr:MAG TPA: hypothetical protein [Myoviridae sp. ctaOv25]